MFDVKTLTLVTAVALAPVAGVAATVQIDSFDTTQQVIDPMGGGVPSADTSPAGEAIGGMRTIIADGDGPLNPTLATGVTVFGGSARVSNGSGVNGTGEFIWDAGGVDLTSGGTNTQFVLEVIDVDLDVMFDLTVDGVTATSTATSTAGTITFDFAAFAGADLTDAFDISLLVSGPTSFDAEIDFLGAAAVPLPAGGLLLGSILLGGGFAARRKAKKA